MALSSSRDELVTELDGWPAARQDRDILRRRKSESSPMSLNSDMSVRLPVFRSFPTFTLTTRQRLLSVVDEDAASSRVRGGSGSSARLYAEMLKTIEEHAEVRLVEMHLKAWEQAHKRRACRVRKIDSDDILADTTAYM